ncbi:alcohol dehydrogenase GroES-like domain-containing protein [Colletotrichum scovillei]|uniref:alcohol dehydrogenase GroES-like domain-containing protein n=1 Tax=Colletotrichum scovillei TaxID=1209932 RepID=UPI0015C321F7|nr:alcohol dehydrogenase GroES-like domain-containing protein [Colletotrichum scovillei]KAF4775053.1 alcohol dehydrogenase GroES-like domain-containing protein [Colletotrichum scovillei]
MALNNTLGALMRGVMYRGVPGEMTVENIPMPTILNQTDAIVRITTSALCGSDLHVYRGYQGGAPPWNMGHEAIGYISELGSAVSGLEVGDYVIIPDTVNHGRLEMEPAGLDFYGNGAVITDGLQWDTVAVFGSGPVGLMAAYSATLRGASRVYVIDHVQARLDLAASIGAIPINFAASDPVAQIMASEPNGVMRSVDCVGIEALNSTLEHQPNIILDQMVNLTHIGGGIGQVGVYMAQPDSPGSPLGSTFSPIAEFPLSDFFGKRLKFQAGPVDPKLYATMLVDLISSGKASPHFIASASISIEDVPAYYARFNTHDEVKVFINFP